MEICGDQGGRHCLILAIRRESQVRKTSQKTSLLHGLSSNQAEDPKVKSRKLGFLGFRKRKTSSRDLGVKSKSLIRKGLFETLENRELMAGDWDASYAALTGKFTSSEARNSFISWVNSMSDGGSGSKLNGEGGPGGATTVSEAEPNNTRNAAQLVPFGLQTGQFQAVSISGSNLTTDVDWYAFDLKGVSCRASSSS